MYLSVPFKKLLEPIKEIYDPVVDCFVFLLLAHYLPSVSLAFTCESSVKYAVLITFGTKFPSGTVFSLQTLVALLVSGMCSHL